jgi:hypothetical protein
VPREQKRDPILEALVSELGDLIVEMDGRSLSTHHPSELAGPAVEAARSVMNAAEEVKKFVFGAHPGSVSAARAAVESAKQAVTAARVVLGIEHER